MNFSFFRCLAACRTRPSACVTRSRPCVRSVLCWFAFPSVSGLGSTASATGRPALFVGFSAHMGSCESSQGLACARYGSVSFPRLGLRKSVEF